MVKEGFENLVVALKEASKTGNGITFINSRDDEEFMSYEELYNKSFQIYHQLKAMKVERKSEVVFQFSNAKSLILTFWACLIGEYIPIPVETANNEYTYSKLLNIWAKLSDPYLVYDTSNYFSKAIKEMTDKEKTKLLKSIELKSFDFNEFNLECVSEAIIEEKNYNNDNIAYIQFSSGSTGDPKGVIIKNSNVFTNSYDFISRLEFTINDSFLTWKPLTHDFSMIMFHLIPIILGANQCHIPTKLYIRSPILWFQKVHEHRATVLATPSFGMQHLIKYMKNRSINVDWDLSCVRVIVNGAEQVSYDLCNEFKNMMRVYNMSDRAIIPGYGLAEATLGVSTCELNTELVKYNLDRKYLNIGEKVHICEEEDNKNGIIFVEVGKPLESIELKITDNNGRTLNDYKIGYIKVRGGNVSDGYYNDLEKTHEVFESDGWLNTGDLGFVVNNKLTMIGRAKEIITVNGVNYACHDIENIICKNIDPEGLNKYAVCNGYNDETQCEQAILFVYYKGKMETFSEMSKRIAKLVFDKVGLTIDEIIPLVKIPKTTSGKVRRTELSTRYNNGEFKSILAELHKLEKYTEKNETDFKNITRDKITTYIVEEIEKLLQIKVNDYDIPFIDYGMVSVNIPEFINTICKKFNIEIEVTSIFDYPNINRFSSYIYDEIKEKTISSEDIKRNSVIYSKNQVAIVGASCRFPGGANDLESYWNLLVNDQSGIADIPEERWDMEKYYDSNKEAPGKMYTKKGGFLNIPVDSFDAQFFNISPKEAITLDPQQRILLELTWEAFENAGLDISEYFGTNTGVYLGISGEEYSLSHMNSGDLTKINPYSLTGKTFSTACGRISYTFGFEGPCFSVDTACSSALTALHIACKAIESGEIDTAVVAGVNLIITPLGHIGFSKLQAISPDGVCKTFDASANGYGRGEGAGVIILKRLKDAENSNDNILGVIRGTAINQDGKSNGLTAPNSIAQQKVIIKALKDADLKETEIDYVEMHGTGTQLGDPIEVNAVVNAYCKGRSHTEPLKIGSVKSNIGHLEAAAGIASIIKVLLSLKNNKIPANLNFNTPNPKINWAAAPIKVVDENMTWDNKSKLRIAGINGFGFGGSNAHIIIQEYLNKEEANETQDGIDYVLKLSAKTKSALKNITKNYIDYIENHENVDIKNIVYTTNNTRTNFNYRMAIVGKTREELIDKMKNYLNKNGEQDVFTNIDQDHVNEKTKIAFMFSGQGSQYVGMGKQLYENNSIFREAFDECDKLFRPYILKSLVELIYGEKASNEIIEKTIFAQPLIFAIEYSLFKLWENIGVVPDIVLGHSIGEYMAAVAANIITLKTAVKLVATRGRLMDSAPGNGGMASIFADIKTVNSLLKNYEEKVSIAVYNAENNIVISGDKTAIEEILKLAEQKGIRVRQLKVSHGFHSALMEPILDDFKLIAAEEKFSTPKITYISSMLGDKINDQDVLNEEYWTSHIKEKVNFRDAIIKIKDIENLVFLEVGSDRILSALCKLTLDSSKKNMVSLNRKKEDVEQLALTIGELYANGVDINWNNVETKGKKKWNKVLLPTYPFERQKHWREPIYEKNNIGRSNSANSYDPILGEKITSPCLKNSIIFQSNFTSNTPYFMEEHIIFDTSISPAAAHISMLLSALKKLSQPQSCTLENVEFRYPLAVKDDEERTVQIVIEDQKSASTKFEIISKDNSDENIDWIKHCQGSVEIIKDKQEITNISIEELQNRFPIDDFVSKFYDEITDFGFNLGKGFQGLKKMWRSGNEGVCLIEPNLDIPHLDSYVLYPGVIDSIFQTIMVISLANEISNGKTKSMLKTTIPYSVKKLTYNYKKSKYFWCYTKMNMQKEVLIANFVAYNEKGERILEVENIMAKFTDRSTLLREVNNNDQMLYSSQWMEKKLEEAKVDLEVLDKVLLVSDDIQLGNYIKENLAKENVDIITVILGNEYKAISDDTHYISLDEQEEYSKLIKDLILKYKNNNFTVLYTCGMNRGNEEIASKNLLESERVNCRGLLYLVQTITKLQLSERIKIKVITNNVQAVEQEENLNILQASLWGFSKVIKLEHPNLWSGIIDIDFSVLEESTHLLVNEINNKKDKQVVLRKDGKRYVPILIKKQEIIKNSTTKNNPIEIKDDSTYIITGGLGTLGLVYAEYIISKGAKYLALVGRREPNEKAMQRLTEWRNKGINVLSYQADICNERDTENLMSEIRNSMPQIKGIIHAAGTLDDKMIMDQSWETFKNVLIPKTVGTYNIHNSLKNDELDFFIMLSSITSIVGNLGQSNYSAANYFLNAFSHYRELNNLSGSTVCWGPWSGGGMAEDNINAAKNMEKLGIKNITIENGIKLIDKLFNENYTEILVADVDWNVFINEADTDSNKEFLSKVVKVIEESKDDKENLSKYNDIMKTLDNLRQDEQRKYLLNTLQKICGKVMGFSKDQLPASNIALTEQGADSLMIFSIRNELNKMMGKELDVSVFFNYATLEKLSEYLLTEILLKEEKNIMAKEVIDDEEDILSEIESLIK